MVRSVPVAALLLVAAFGAIATSADKDADKTDPPPNPHEALIRAAQRGSEDDVMAFLRAANASSWRNAIHLRLSNNFTALHMGAFAGNTRIVAALLSHGGRPDVNALDIHHDNPLHMAAVRRHAAVAELLLAFGADTCHRTLGGLTPVQMAAAAGLEANGALVARVGAHWQCAVRNASQGNTCLFDFCLPLDGLGGAAGDRCPARAAFERASAARRRAPWGVDALPLPATDRHAPGPGAGVLDAVAALDASKKASAADAADEAAAEAAAAEAVAEKTEADDEKAKKKKKKKTKTKKKKKPKEKKKKKKPKEKKKQAKKQAKKAKAEAKQQQKPAEKEPAPAPSPAALAMKFRLAADLHKEGKYAEAEPLYRAVIAAARRGDPGGDAALTPVALQQRRLDTSAAVSSLGSLLKAKGAVAEALPLFREALAGFAAVAGPEHPARRDFAEHFSHIGAESGAQDPQLLRSDLSAFVAESKESLAHYL